MQRRRRSSVRSGCGWGHRVVQMRGDRGARRRHEGGLEQTSSPYATALNSRVAMRHMVWSSPCRTGVWPQREKASEEEKRCTEQRGTGIKGAQDSAGSRRRTCARPLRRLTSSTHKRLCSSLQRQLPRPPSPIVARATPACSAMPTAHMPMQKNPSPPKRFGGPKGVSGGHQGRHVPQMIGGQEGPRGKEGKGTLPGGRPHRTHAPPTSSPPIPTLRKDSGASNTQK
jgi:hypothetical protein